MNLILQNILVLICFSLAIGYLVKKFFWKTVVKSNTKSQAACGKNDCGCH